MPVRRRDASPARAPPFPFLARSITGHTSRLLQLGLDAKQLVATLLTGPACVYECPLTPDIQWHLQLHCAESLAEMSEC